MISFLFYTDHFVKEGRNGIAIGPFIFIRPAKRNDLGILVHERVHVAQFWNPKWWFRSKLAWEVAAYKAQAAYYRDGIDRIPHFAKVISDRYGFKITSEEAERLLRG